jgi:hypothetical protein
VLTEPKSQRARDWLGEDPVIATWAWTRVELKSAVERRARAGEIDRRERRTALSAFESLAASWDEVTDLQAVRTRALTLLARYPLRAADAAQLAAATLVAEDEPASLTFVCLDERLSIAAEQEGFRVLE